MVSTKHQTDEGHGGGGVVHPENVHYFSGHPLLERKGEELSLPEKENEFSHDDERRRKGPAGGRVKWKSLYRGVS